MEGPSSLSSWPPRHGTTAPRLPPPDRAARGASSPRTCQCRRTRPLPLLSHDAATAPLPPGMSVDLQLGFCSWSRLPHTRASRPSRAQTSAPAFVSPSLRARACFGTVFLSISFIVSQHVFYDNYGPGHVPCLGRQSPRPPRPLLRGSIAIDLVGNHLQQRAALALASLTVGLYKRPLRLRQ